MQQQYNYIEAIVVVPWALCGICSSTGDAQIYNTRIVLSFINCCVRLVLFRLKFIVLFLSSMEWPAPQQLWLVVTLDVLIASLYRQPSCCLRARGRHVQQLYIADDLLR